MSLRKWMKIKSGDCEDRTDATICNHCYNTDNCRKRALITMLTAENSVLSTCTMKRKKTHLISITKALQIWQYICLCQHADEKKLLLITTHITEHCAAHGLGNSRSDTGLWCPVAPTFISEGVGEEEEEEEEELSAGRRISADCWFPVICCCCCGSVCLSTGDAVRLSSMGAFTLAKLDRESLDSWMVLSTLWMGPWQEEWQNISSLVANMWVAYIYLL